MKSKPLPPLEELRENIDYNPDTGIFTWIKKPSIATKVGQEAGSVNKDGYICISFRNNLYYAHRLAYYMYYGIDPLEKKIDHICGSCNNNKINNLRLATHSQNLMNRVVGIDNNSGATGVGWNKKSKKWRARINLDCVEKHLGYFTNKEDAIQARNEAEVKYYGEFRRQD